MRILLADARSGLSRALDHLRKADALDLTLLDLRMPA